MSVVERHAGVFARPSEFVASAVGIEWGIIMMEERRAVVGVWCDEDEFNAKCTPGGRARREGARPGKKVI